MKNTTQQLKSETCSLAIAGMLAECEDLLSRINETFYVKGTTKALMPVMAETKPILGRIRELQARCIVEVESIPTLPDEGKSLEQMAKIMIGTTKATQ